MIGLVRLGDGCHVNPHMIESIAPHRGGGSVVVMTRTGNRYLSETGADALANAWAAALLDDLVDQAQAWAELEDDPDDDPPTRIRAVPPAP